MAFLHPVLGAATIALTLWILSRGLTARSGTRQATAARRVHKKWAPWVFAAMVASGLSGTASTVWLRDDLELGETWHLAVGWTAIGVMGATGLLTRAFTRNPALRGVHPWIGVVAAVLALIQGFLGFELLP
jgi:Protein of unknown function (DUF4079)